MQYTLVRHLQRVALWLVSEFLALDEQTINNGRIQIEDTRPLR
jgi:hypothetical protein